MDDYRLINRLVVIRNWLKGGMWTVGSEAGTSAAATVDEAITRLRSLTTADRSNNENRWDYPSQSDTKP